MSEQDGIYQSPFILLQDGVEKKSIQNSESIEENKCFQEICIPAEKPKTKYCENYLKPGKKAWRYTDKNCIHEFTEKIKENQYENVIEEIIEILNDKSKWVYYPNVAIVFF